MLKLTDNSLYQAIELFESNKMLDSINWFVKSFLEGNLFAVPYLNHLIQNNNYSIQELNTELKKNDEMYDFIEFHENTPHRYYLEDNLKASLIIQKISHDNNSFKKNNISLYDQLLDLSNKSFSAVIYFIKLNHIEYKVNYKKLIKNMNSNFSILLYLALEYYREKNIELDKQLIADKVMNEKLLLINKLLKNPNFNQNEMFEYNVASWLYPELDTEKYNNFIKISALMGNIKTQSEEIALSKSISTYGKNTLNWYFVSAFRENATSQLALAKKYLLLGTDEGNNKLIYWFKRALKNDCSFFSEEEVKNACNTLGIFLNLKKNYIESEHFSLRAAKVGSYESLIRLGDHNYYGSVRKKNYNLALNFYKKAIDIFEKTNSNKYDLEKSYQLFEKMVDMYHTGGDKFENDGRKALEILSNLPKLTDKLKSIYGTYLFDGYLYIGKKKQVIKKNIPLAIKYFKESAESSNESAFCLLEAYELLEKTNILPDIKNELKCSLRKYLELAKDSYPEDLNRYWISYQLSIRKMENPEEAITYIQEGVKNNYTEALLIYASASEEGYKPLKIEKNLKTALECYQKVIEIRMNAALSDYIEGYVLQNDKLLNTINESKQNKLIRYNKARIKFEVALENNFIRAATYLSKIHENGLGIEKSLKKAIGYLEKAKSLHDAEIYHNLARLYTKEEVKDLKLASENFELAVQNNHKESLYPSVQCFIEKLINEELSLDELDLNNLLLRLKPCMSNNDKLAHKEIKATYWYGLLSLLNGAPLNEIKVLFNQNTMLLDFKPIKYFLKFVEQKTTISSVETLIFLTQIKPLDFLGDTISVSNENLKAQKSSDNLPTLELYNIHNRKDKIWHEICLFSDYDNLKKVNINSFKKILILIRKLNPKISFEIEPSKSSNQNFKVFLPNTETIAYSYHPRHKSGSGMDKEYDVKRAKGLQDQVKQISERIALNG